MKKLYLALLFLAFGLMTQAQNISVADFYLAENDLTARTHGTSVEDQNGNLCALIKVKTTERGNWAFDVGMLGVRKTEDQIATHPAEIWVYVPFGVTWISIQHDKLGELDHYRIPCSIDKGCTYVMKLTTGKVIIHVEEQVNQQYLAFRISPSNATLEVNDGIWELDADGNAQDFVKFGTYSYRVQAPNYHTSVGKVTVNNPDSTKFVSVKLDPNFGWIEIAGTGDLQGASVYVDNALIGKAPCKSDALKSGQHTVRIAKKMYASFSQTVTVSDNETTRLAPTLAADFAEVTLNVDADAEIWVNNEKKGTRTWTGPLGSGTYKMECKQANHETSLTTKEITAAMNGQAITLPPPTPIYGSLMVESTPMFCKLYIDGKDMGTTPRSINEILIGQHEIKLTQDGYADYNETVTITQGKRKQMKATLDVKESSSHSNQMKSISGKPDGAVSGKFSVSASKKVYFAKGNLQYQASTNTWRFAEHQWDCMGDSNKYISSSYSGWIDLFGWGTGNNPTKTSKDNSDYSTFSDWGDKVGGGWRTLTQDEWKYVFDERRTSSGIRYAKATVNGVRGVILLPDNWSETSYNLNKTNTFDADYNSNSISFSTWNATFAPAGAVFLPAAGNHLGTSVYNVGSNGPYWSASALTSNVAYDVFFYSGNLYPSNISECNNGHSVRLVATAADYQDYTATPSVTENSNSHSIQMQSVMKDEETFTVNGVSFTMKLVEGGTFQMGSNDNDAGSDEKPVHNVTLSSYSMGETEVTQALWQAVMGSNPSRFKGDNLPVEQVSWNDVQEFIRKLSQKTGKNFRLPTEAEWEYAARGGKKSKGYKYSGSNTINNVAWYTETTNDSGTKTVKTKSPNELGLYDMSGNVWEWCQDWSGSYSSGSQTNPTGPSTGSYRVLRGGSWGFNARRCRVLYRNGSDPGNRSIYYGFRLCLPQ